MRASAIMLYATENDTLPIRCTLSTSDGTTTTLVSDSDTVNMHVSHTGGPSTIAGTALGDSSGTFLFDTSALPAGTWDCQLEVNDGTYLFTVATGAIQVDSDIA